jgi:sn-glycerol 3-phosphate transport system ATP-binding protein
MAEVRFTSVSKTYANGVRAVRAVSFVLAPAETVSVVGPSGGGKSTLLRLAAGLEEPTGGEVRLDGKVVTAIPPEERRVALAFQVPALYPHLTVRENLAFPLRYRGVASAEGEARVTAAAGALEIDALLDRMPHELSGGQRQRVALGRCLVARPTLLLLDEPLSQLDVPLRAAVRAVITNHKIAFGTTVIWVTHDPHEAREVSKRVLTMEAGELSER